MLSHDERRRLGSIETWARIDDPEFADGLAFGKPHPPREYRRWPMLVLLCVGALSLAVGLFTSGVVAALFGALLVLTALRMWLRRQLDAPSNAGPPRR
jgi:hypothetical protein